MNSFKMLQRHTKSAPQEAIPALSHPFRPFASSAPASQTQATSFHKQDPPGPLVPMHNFAQIALFPRTTQPGEDAFRQTIRRTPSMSQNAAAPIQRRVVNVGKESLGVEFAKERGWIIAKSVDLTLQWGGKNQTIEPAFERIARGKPVDEKENIYLVGHGAAGHVGSKTRTVQEVIQALNPIIPSGYQGGIFAATCWAGASETATGETVKPGVEELASGLKQPNIPVVGARGKTYSHPALGGPEGSIRVVKPSASGRSHEVSSELEKQFKVSISWMKEVVKDKKEIPEGELRAAGQKATELSAKFYIQLIATLEKENALFPPGKDAFTIPVTKHKE